MRRRREVNVFGLAFLDAMTCGFGAAVLLYMIINAAVGQRSGDMSADLRGEVDRLEREVLDGTARLVELRNSVEEVEHERVVASGLSRRLLEALTTIREELATFEERNLARREHVNRLKTDLQTLEQDTKRLQASLPSEETPGDRTRVFVGDGDRQYLTGLKVGGERVFILVDVSASMLADTIVNVVRRRHLPKEARQRAEKWRQAVRTVDWLTTQLPRDSRFQVYVFADRARSVLEGRDGVWLDAGDPGLLDASVDALRAMAPAGGTSLYHGFDAARGMTPPPDNLILLTDGLPTRGEAAPRQPTVGPKERLRLFERALDAVARRMVVNTILFPMEGDPMAPASYWQLAMATGGSLITPSSDWP